MSQHSTLDTAKCNSSLHRCPCPGVSAGAVLFVILLPAKINRPPEPFRDWPLVSLALIFTFVHHLETKLGYPVETRVFALCVKGALGLFTGSGEMALLSSGNWRLALFCPGRPWAAGCQGSCFFSWWPHRVVIPCFSLFYKSKSFSEIQSHTTQLTYLKCPILCLVIHSE